MRVKKIYINTHRYDFPFAKVCIASVRYWYPDIPIVLIKDIGSGAFDTSHAERKWNVSVLDCPNKVFGWGYGKLETLFQQDRHSFLVLDADTVMVGPIIDHVEQLNGCFIVDDEVQPKKRFNEIYYDLDRINELEPSFRSPGYSFNTGQWFGTSGILSRSDFSTVLEWTSPPKPKYPEILFNGDQGLLNFVLHKKEQEGNITIFRKKIMVWPKNGNSDFIQINRIKKKDVGFPYIIHWAGMKFDNFRQLPRYDIIRFFGNYYYASTPGWRTTLDRLHDGCLAYEKRVKRILKRLAPFQ